MVYLLQKSLYDPPPCWAAEFFQKYFIIFLLSTQDINTL